MAEYRRTTEQKTRRTVYEEYVDGNTVRKRAVEAERMPEQVPERERKQLQNPKRKVDQRPLVGFRRNIDFFMMSVLGISFAVILVLAFRYLRVSAEVTEMNKTLANMTKEYETVKGENDSLLFDIADDINLNEVYRIAVGKLGMVYPNNNQIVEFINAGDGYVRQYDSVPEAADEGNTDAVAKVLRRLLK